MQSRSHPLVLSLALCALSVCVFHNVGTFEFLNYDDSGYVSGNPWVQQGLTFESVSNAFVARDTNLWHPLTWISHAADVEFFGLDAGRHHLVNLAIHLANSLLVFFFLRMASGKEGASFAVAALFAVHPMHVESVAWISERKGLLAAFFWLLGLIAYARYQRSPNWVGYLGVTAALVAALFSKPVAVTFPIVLLALDIWPFSRLPTDRLWRWRDPELRAAARGLILEKVPWLLLVAGFALLTIVVQARGSHSAYIDQDPLLLRSLAAIPAYGDYLIRTFWPTSLIPDYPEPTVISLWKAFGLSLAGLGLTVLAVRFAGRFPWILSGWLWFLIVLLPTLGVVDLGRVYTADRYMYLPIIGVFVIICWGGQAFYEAASRRGQLLIAACGLAVVLGFGCMSRSQVAVWSDSKSLFRHTLTKNPTSQIALTNLGQKLQDEGQLDEASTHYRRLVEHHPGFYLGHYNLGTVRAAQLRHAEAERHFRQAAELNPTHLPTLLDLSASLARQNRAEEARPFLKKALELDPANEIARWRLQQLGP